MTKEEYEYAKASQEARRLRERNDLINDLLVYAFAISAGIVVVWLLF